MNVLNRTLRVMMLAAVLTIGLAAAATAATKANWAVASILFTGHRLAVLLAGALLCLLGLLFAWSGFRGHRHEKYLCFDNEGGRVSISTQAIADYLARLAEEFQSIIRLKPIVVPLRSEIDVVADVRIKAGPQIHEICETLQKRIRERLASGLGITQVRRVEVRVSEINTEHKAE